MMSFTCLNRARSLNLVDQGNMSTLESILGYNSYIRTCWVTIATSGHNGLQYIYKGTCDAVGVYLVQI